MWVHQKQLYGLQPPPSYPSSSGASRSNSDASLPWHLMDNLERPLREGLDQGVPLPPIESLPSSPALMGIQVHPRSPPSLLQLDSPLSSPVEDRSGHISRQSQRVKRKGQRCKPSRLSMWQKLRGQERDLQDLPQGLASLALGGGFLQREGCSQSCDKCWDLPCTYEC